VSHLSSFRSGKGSILEKRSGPTMVVGASSGSVNGSSSGMGGEGGSVRGMSTITGVNVVGSSNKVAPYDDTNDKVYSKSADSGEGKEVGEVVSVHTSDEKNTSMYSGGAGADSPVPIDGSVELVPLLTHNNTTTNNTTTTNNNAIPTTTSAQALRPSLMLKNNNPGSDNDSLSSDDLEEEGFGELGMSSNNNNNRGSVSVGGRSGGGGSVDYTALKDSSPRLVCVLYKFATAVGTYCEGEYVFWAARNTRCKPFKFF